MSGEGPEVAEHRLICSLHPPVSVEVQEQVEVWILNIEKLHRSSIFTPMATALKEVDGDGLSASSIPQT